MEEDRPNAEIRKPGAMLVSSGCWVSSLAADCIRESRKLSHQNKLLVDLLKLEQQEQLMGRTQQREGSEAQTPAWDLGE